MSSFVESPETGRDWGAAWWLVVLAGLIGVAAGVIVLFKPSDSLTTLAVVAGIFVLIDGIAELVASLLSSTANRGLIAILGVLSVVVGVMLIRHPIRGVAAIALLIGIWLIAFGTVRLVLAFGSEEHRAWNAVVAVVEIVGGIVIVSSPGIGLATLALLVGISFIANGVALALLGWRLHQARGHVHPPRHLGATA